MLYVMTIFYNKGDMNSYEDIVSAFNFAGISTNSLNIDSIPEQAQFEWSSDATQIPRDIILCLFRIVNNADLPFDSARALYQNQSQQPSLWYMVT